MVGGCHLASCRWRAVGARLSSFPSRLWDDTADLRQENPGRAMVGSRWMGRRKDPAGWAAMARGALGEGSSISSLAIGKGICALRSDSRQGPRGSEESQRDSAPVQGPPSSQGIHTQLGELWIPTQPRDPTLSLGPHTHFRVRALMPSCWKRGWECWGARQSCLVWGQSRDKRDGNGAGQAWERRGGA